MSDNPKIGPVWVTKHVMTKGVEKLASVEHCVSISKGMIVLPDHWRTNYHSGEWHTDRPTAVAKVAEMRSAKIKSLEKQLAKVRDIDPEKIVPQ